MSQHLRTSHTYRQVQWHTSQTFSRTMIHVQTNIWQRHWSLSWSLRPFQGSESSHCLMTVTESQILLHLHKPPQWWHLNKIYSLTLLSTAMADELAFHALSVLSAKCTVNVNSYSVVTTNYYDPCLMSFFFKCLIWSFHGWITWVQCLFVHKVASLQPANIKKHTATLIFNNKLIVKIKEIESV